MTRAARTPIGCYARGSTAAIHLMTIKVPVEPTPEMEAHGRAIEADHAELDRRVWVQVVRDRDDSWLRSGWKALSKRAAA